MGTVGLNLALGWLLMTLGFLSGALMGLRFRDPNWLGGYDALPRRLVQLAHIACFGMGTVNILFALSAERIAFSAGVVEAASWCMAAGGTLMPALCLAAAWRIRLTPLFTVPVVLLITGGTIAWVGLARAWLTSGATP